MIRNYRTQQGLSQEKLAELSGCHPTYIGRIERGEKNATLESVEKIASALNIPLSQLFEKLDGTNAHENISLKCYEFFAAKTEPEQNQLFHVLIEIEKIRLYVNSWGKDKIKIISRHAEERFSA